IWPENILLVVDAMIGQDAVKTAKAFHERLTISGVVLTKLDGDARGGAALSVKEVTGAPVLFTGIGETTDKFEEFRADGMASRILGMGDVLGLMQDFEEVVDKKKAEEDAARMLQGEFTLDDFLDQVRMIQKMGSLRDLVDKIPMLGGKIPGMKQMGMAKNLRKAMASGGFPGGMPGMGMPGMGTPGMGMPGMGMPGMGMPGMGAPFGMPGLGAGDSMTKMKPLSKTEKN